MAEPAAAENGTSRRSSEEVPILPTGAPLFPSVPPPTNVIPFLDPYSEDVTDFDYLRSKPTCIVFIGKPGSGRSMLAKRLAKEWNMCYIHPKTLVERFLPPVDDSIAEGEAPEIPEFTAAEGEGGGTEKKEKTERLTKEEEEFQSEIRRRVWAGEELSDDLLIEMIKEKMYSPEVAHYGYILDEFPSLSEQEMSMKDQLELLKTFPLQPDFIVHMKLSDEDLLKRRLTQKVDPVSGNIYPRMIYDPDDEERALLAIPEKGKKKQFPRRLLRVNDSEEDNEDEEGEDGGYDSDDLDDIANRLPFDPRELTMQLSEAQLYRLLRRPEDGEDNVRNNLKVYRQKMLPLLREFMADHDQSQVLELDANRNNTYLFRVLKARLAHLGGRPPVVPQQLLDPDNENEEIPDEVDTEELILKLNSVRMLAPRFRWQRSKWLRMCPVELSRGNVVQGRPEFAVGFLDKLYILSTQEALDLFMQNPRRFLFPPQPRFPVKLAVIGPNLSGKTTMANELARFYDATVVDLSLILRPAIEGELEAQNNTLREALLQDALIQIKNRILSAEQESIDHMAGIVADREVDDLVDKEIQDNLADYLDPYIVMMEEKAAREEEEARLAEEERRRLSDLEFEKLRERVVAKEKRDERRRREEEGIDLGSLASLDMTSDTDVAVDAETGEENKAGGLQTGTESGLASNTPGGIPHDDRLSTGDGFKSQGGRSPESGLGRYGVDGEDPELYSPGYVSQPPWGAELDDLEAERETMEVSENHPEVQLLLRELMEEHKRTFEDISLSPETIVDLTKAKLAEVEEDRLRGDPASTNHGGWILDNFPHSKEVWLAFVNDPLITPVEVVRLRESDPQTNNVLASRWWATKGGALFAAREAQRRALDDVIEEDEEAAKKVEPIAEEASVAVETENDATERPDVSQGPTDSAAPEEQLEEVPSVHLTKFGSTVIPDNVLEDFVELEDFRRQMREFDAEWPQILSILRDNEIEPMIVDVDEKTTESMITEIDEKIQELIAKNAVAASGEDQDQDAVKYEHRAWEFQGQDIDQEEEDLEQDALDEAAALLAEGGGRGGRSNDDDSEEDEGEGGEGPPEVFDWVALTYNLEPEDAAKMRKRFLGDTKHFCPVALKETGVLWPGDPDKAAVYRNKIYYFSADEAREKFIKTPKDYVAGDEPLKYPPLRVLFLGPKGSGKTAHGRALSRKLGIFHFSFREKLMELILLKHGKRIGPEYDDEEEEEEEKEEEEEEVIQEPENPPIPEVGLDVETGEELVQRVTGQASTTSSPEVPEPPLKLPPSPVMEPPTDLPEGMKVALQCACPDEEEEVVIDDDDVESIPVRQVPSVKFSDPVVQDPKTPYRRPDRRRRGPDEAGDGEEDEGLIVPVDFELDETENAILAYLADATGSTELPEELLEDVISPLWRKEPFRSRGFILEGFPNTSNEAKFLSDKGLYPDCAIVLQVEEKDVLARLVPSMMDRWQAKMDKKRAKRMEEKAKLKKKQEEEREKRRQELIEEFRAKNEEEKRKKSAVRRLRGLDDDDEADEGGSEEEMMEEIEQILIEEEGDDDEEEEEEEESPEDAHEKFCMKISEWYEGEMTRMEEVQKNLSEDYWIPCLEVDGARQPHIVRYVMRKRLRPLTEHRASVFDRCYPLRAELARRLVVAGYRKASRFGVWCPVQLYDGACLVPAPGPAFPLLFRSHVYFLSSVEARDRFADNPVLFVRQVAPKPAVPLKLAILGPPKSGKTTLANHVAEVHGVPRVSVGDSLRDLLDTQPKVDLTARIRHFLHQGLTVPDDLAVEALDVYLLEERFQSRGWVLDSYPMTENQMKLMDDEAIIPLKVIELEMGDREMLTRGLRDRLTDFGKAWTTSLEYSSEASLGSIKTSILSFLTDDEDDNVNNNNVVFSTDIITAVMPERPEFIKHDSTPILKYKREAYLSNIDAIRNFFRSEEANWSPLDGARSKWWVRHHALEECYVVVRQIQEYIFRVKQGLAASLVHLCVRPAEFRSRLGIFREYCPVALADEGEFVDGSEEDNLKYAVEYRGVYYKTSGEAELATFLERTEEYLPPLAPRRLPEDPDYLPIKRDADWVKEQHPAQPEILGYCPVTYRDGRLRYEAIVDGDPRLVVQYRGKFWYFRSEKERVKFMRKPYLYFNLTMPRKLPPKKLEPLHVSGLPMLGYMEQTVATAVIKALTATGNFKPKYPFLSPARSALLYVAFHLKAFNPRSTEYVRNKYKRKLAQFEETCEIISYLGTNMAPFYTAPQQRPIEFDSKMETFIGLRNLKAVGSALWLKEQF